MIICINQLFQSREHSLHPRCAEGRTDRQKEGQTGRQRDRQPMLAAGAVICPLAGCQTAPGLPVAAWRALRSTAPPYRPLAVAPRHSGGAPSRPLAAAARHCTTLKARRGRPPPQRNSTKWWRKHGSRDSLCALGRRCGAGTARRNAGFGSRTK